MGELKKRKKLAVAQASEEFVVVQSMGGRMHVRWDDTAPATPHGQLVYFAQYGANERPQGDEERGKGAHGLEPLGKKVRLSI
jgi:hypothetical protein